MSNYHHCDSNFNTSRVCMPALIHHISSLFRGTKRGGVIVFPGALSPNLRFTPPLSLLMSSVIGYLICDSHSCPIFSYDTLLSLKVHLILSVPLITPLENEEKALAYTLNSMVSSQIIGILSPVSYVLVATIRRRAVSRPVRALVLVSDPDRSYPHIRPCVFNRGPDLFTFPN